MYSYDDRYMISATLRSDASSRLAPGYQWHTYPAVSAGWNINREAFMGDRLWILTLPFDCRFILTNMVQRYKLLMLTARVSTFF